MLGVSPLYGAATNGRTNLVERLVEAGAELELLTELGDTALMGAARYGEHGTVQVGSSLTPDWSTSMSRTVPRNCFTRTLMQ